MERYELVKDLGAGNFGVARLLRHKETKELVAMKYIERGLKVKLFFSTLLNVKKSVMGFLFESLVLVLCITNDERFNIF